MLRFTHNSLKKTAHRLRQLLSVGLHWVVRHPVISLVLLLAIGLAGPQPAHAYLAVITRMMGAVMFVIITFLGRIIVFFFDLLIQVAPYNNFINSDAVKIGWVISRDLVNLVFILSLLAIAIGTILGVERYQWSKTVIKLVFMILLVNFSRLICGIVIDAGQVVMLTFVNAIQAAGLGNFTYALHLYDIVSFSQSAPPEGVDSTALIGSMILGVILLFIAFIIVAVIAVSLVVRIVVLWVLIILSPFAFTGGILPQTEEWTSRWWKTFTGYIIFGPTMIFFLWIGLYVGSRAGTEVLSAQQYNPETQSLSPSYTYAVTKVGTPQNLAGFLAAAALMAAGIVVAKDLGSFGGALAGVWLGKLSAAGMGAAAGAIGAPFLLGKKALGGALSYGDEKTGGWLNPVRYYAKWRENRDEKKMENLHHGEAKRKELIKTLMMPTELYRRGRFYTNAMAGGASLADARRQYDVYKKAQEKLQSKDDEKNQIISQAKLLTGGTEDGNTLAEQHGLLTKGTDGKLEETEHMKELRAGIAKTIETGETAHTLEAMGKVMPRAQRSKLGSLQQEFAEKPKSKTEQKAYRTYEKKMSEWDDLQAQIAAKRANGEDYSDLLTKSNTAVNAAIKAIEEIKGDNAGKKLLKDMLLTRSFAGFELTKDKRTMVDESIKEIQAIPENQRTPQQQQDLNKFQAQLQPLAGIGAQVALHGGARRADEVIQGYEDTAMKYMPKRWGYVDRSTRAHVQQELAKIKENNWEVLAAEWVATMQSGDHIKAEALLLKVTQDANENEFMNYIPKFMGKKGAELADLTITSDAKGLQKFAKRIMVDEYGMHEEEANRIANDVSYEAEKIGHWATARAFGYGFDRHTGQVGLHAYDEKEILANQAGEMAKMTLETKVSRLNRLAFVGEAPDYDPITGEDLGTRSPVVRPNTIVQFREMSSDPEKLKNLLNRRFQVSIAQALSHKNIQRSILDAVAAGILDNTPYVDEKGVEDSIGRVDRSLAMLEAFAKGGGVTADRLNQSVIADKYGRSE